MHDIQQINIDKYLEWYERLSNELKDYPAIKQRFDILSTEKKEGSLLKAAQWAFSVTGEEKYKQWEEKNREYEYLFDELQRLMQYDSKEYYIPTDEDWQLLYFSRVSCLEEKKNAFKASIEKSVLNEKALAQQELELIKYEIFSVYNFFENIRAGTPLLNSVVNANANVGGEYFKCLRWGVFCQWVYNLDFAKWLSSQIIEDTHGCFKHNPPKQTVEGIALYYYYLLKGGEDGLSNTDTLTNAVKTFGVSRKTLQNKWNKISEKEITIVPKNTNERLEKHNRLRFAYSTLKERSTNKKAIDSALQHLKEFENRMNLIVNKQFA